MSSIFTEEFAISKTPLNIDHELLLKSIPGNRITAVYLHILNNKITTQKELHSVLCSIDTGVGVRGYIEIRDVAGMRMCGKEVNFPDVLNKRWETIVGNLNIATKNIQKDALYYQKPSLFMEF